MNANELLRLYGASQHRAALQSLLEDKSVRNVFLQGLMASATPALFASLNGTRQHFLFILPDADEAGYFYHDLTQLLGTEQVLFFPSSYRRAVKYGQRDAANEILRTEVLARIGNSAPTLYIVTHPEALAELVVSKKRLGERLIRLQRGQTVEVNSLIKQLRSLGFQEQDYVYEPGQFALRGSIIDIFSYSLEYPFRIDFFGNEIDTIRTFSVEDQLSKEQQTEATIVPELAMEQEKVPFLQLLADNTMVAAKDIMFVRDVIQRVYQEGFSTQALNDRLSGATEQEQAGIMHEMRAAVSLCTAAQFSADMQRFRLIEFGSSSVTPQASLSFHIEAQPLFHKNFELLAQTLDDYRSRGYTVYILADSKKQQQRLREILETQGTTTFTPVDSTLHEGFVDHDLQTCFFTDHQIFDRFHKYNLKSDRARAGKMALTMKELQELEPGDFLVHVDFGIGKFGGLVRVPLPSSSPAKGSNDNGYQEMIRLIYQRGDIVDVSIHSLYKISKYRSNNGEKEPRLSTLGTGAWERMKERTKKRIKDIARDLIKLYARRRQEKGFAFSADSYLQHELEASFLYEDTPDQMKATQEVKADMEEQKPMDRLVCGDVGFGKTEVAVRAAFKAACDSKQVAVLVPTTVLCFQHYQTFSERLKGMPVRVDYLSRARSAKKAKEILADLREGKIDILIGTHKLISKSVQWKDLGLLIIDEEQKFGVSTKEKLRQLKTNVDTLTMSATPIPRTLQFSLMGARDMSIIRTPPPNRYPIETTLSSYGSEVITDAINFEMSRNGQVFFVNDRISNLPEIEALIKRNIPDCRVVIGHGKMPPEELEKVIMGFINYDYDVLLSTTIVENGVDIPNANTIIINDAHRFGLSDLHQMRGRVGRSNRKAFCYLLSPPKAYITSEARRRLEALENFSELGSGFNLAMQDLDIRGAGNLLGAEQSGFMEDLGYETYLKILKEAMAELANETHDLPDSEAEGSPGEKTRQEGDMSFFSANPTLSFVADCAVESDLEMYFPDSYVPGSSERMLLYRELDNIENDRDLAAYRARLEDRFGPIPHEGEELMQVVTLRRIGKRLGCEKIILRQGRMTIQFVSNSESPYYQSKAFGCMLDYIATHARRCDLKEVKGRRLMHISDISSVAEGVEVLRSIEQMKA
ncbi:MAG: transcription-repair coupling factor [Prevotella sp.]|nr:transcription-repair coupling factor [Prevotella sp.]